MRVLFTTWAWPSHLYPLVPLAWAFRLAGHEVCVASQPSLTDAITASGLTAVPVGREMGHDVMPRHARPESILLDPRTSELDYEWPETERQRWRTMKTVFCMVADCMVDELVEFARCWSPDLVISDQTTFAGFVTARVLGVPDARLLYGPDITGPRGRTEETLRPTAYTELFERFGVEPSYELARWTIDPCPPAMRTPTGVDRLPMRYVPYSGGEAMPAWLLEEPKRPRVCITWGTAQLQLAHEDTVKVPMLLDQLADYDVDVIVVGAGPYRHLLTTIPPNAQVFDYLPLNLVVPSCAMLVHQGGAGNMFTAACNGVPQLLFPQVADQGIHAERLARTGAGLVLAADAVTQDAVGQHLAMLLDDSSVHDAAASLRADIQVLPDPAQVARSLEQQVGERVP